jgi:hypothetical protein
VIKSPTGGIAIFLLTVLLVSGCSTDATDQQVEAVEFFCGDGWPELETHWISPPLPEVAENAYSSYLSGHFHRARSLVEKLMSQGCASENSLAYLSLIAAQMGNRQLMLNYLQQAFEKQENLDIVGFVAFELKFSKKLNEAVLAFEYGLNLIVSALDNGQNPRSMRSKTIHDQKGGFEHQFSPEENILVQGFCTAKKQANKLELEFLRFYRVVTGSNKTPVCYGSTGAF